LARARLVTATAALLLLPIAFSARAISFWGDEAEPTPARPAAPQPAAPADAAQLDAPTVTLPNFAALARRLSPEVVNISTTITPASGPQFRSPFGGGPEGDPFHEFWEPFEKHFRRGFKQRSLGSGFIIDRSGTILTNNHVVENADEIVVRLSNQKEFKATVVGRDSKTDVAVIKIEAGEELNAVTLGDSDKLEVGEWVMAIGNPFGLENTITAGIVSGKSRFIGQGSYDDFIQTDAAINPGNSGGPLVNVRGEVVGINSAIFSRTGGNIGIGFAIPINLVKELLPQLREKGKVVRGWLGVYIQKVTPEIAESLGVPDPQGALVADLMRDSPAAKGGLQVGDVIVEFDGQPINESNDLPLLVARTTVGKKVKVKIIRRGDEKMLTVEVGELKDEEVAASSGKAEDFGLSVQNLTPEIAESIGVDPETRGVVVVGVEPGSAADEAGLRRGDVVLEVNREPVETLAAYKKALENAAGKKNLLFLVRRGDNTIFLAVKPGK